MLNSDDPPSGSASHPIARRGINWRQEYLHVGVILMTACWLAPWMTLSLNWFLTISLSTCLGLTAAHLLTTLVLTRWMQHRRVDPSLLLLSILLAMGLAVGLTLLLLPARARAYGTSENLAFADLFSIDARQRVPGGPLAILWVLFLWWRGYQLSSGYMSLVRAGFGMRLGILSLLWVSIFANRALRADILSLIPFFFFFGLTSTSLARANSLDLDRARRGAVFGRGWIASLFLIALAVTVGGHAAALWLSGQDMRHVLSAFTTLAEGAVTLLFLVLSPVLFVVQIIIDGVQSIIKPQGTILQRNPGQRGAPGSTNIPWLADIFGLLGDAFIAALFVFVALLVVAFIWFLFMARGSRKEYDNEEREALGTAEVVGGLRRAWRENWRRLANALGLLRQFGFGRDFFTVLTIRRTYSRMEKLAARRGYPRAPNRTPYEYQRELLQAFPGQSDDIQYVTEAYVAIRYGDVPETRGELERVRAAWERLQASPEPD